MHLAPDTIQPTFDVSFWWYGTNYLNGGCASLKCVPVLRLLPQTSTVKAARHGSNVKLATEPINCSMPLEIWCTVEHTEQPMSQIPISQSISRGGVKGNSFYSPWVGWQMPRSHPLLGLVGAGWGWLFNMLSLHLAGAVTSYQGDGCKPETRSSYGCNADTSTICMTASDTVQL